MPLSIMRYMLFVVLLNVIEKFAYADGTRVVRFADNENRYSVFPDAVEPVYKHRRIARSSSQGASYVTDNSKLIVNKTVLPNEGHNEAIVHWSGQKSQVMFLLTRTSNENGTIISSTLWQSMDFGSSFNQIQSKFPHSDVLLTYFYVCPSNKDKLIFIDTRNTTLYVTSNEGSNFTGIKLSFVPSQLLFHPMVSDSLLAYSEPTRSLYVSNDFAATWTLVDEMVNPRFYWAVPGIDVNPHTIHMECEDPVTGKFVYKAYNTTGADVVNQFGPIDVGSLVVIREYVFAQRTTPFSSHLYISHHRKAFRRAYFPNNAHPLDFSIVSADEHQVFIAASNRGGFVTLYLSDQTGQFYIKSLDHIVAFTRGDNFIADVYEVKGLPGTFIANKHGPVDGKPATYITYNQGGKWQPLNLLSQDAKSTCVPSANCSLYLHLQLDPLFYDIPAPLSEENAPGMILAHGVVGQGKETQFVMSQDGGLTWAVKMNGTYRTSILDQGGAIVALPSNSADANSTQLLYSCTEGMTWESYSFASDRMKVDGLLNEPGITSLVTSVYGHTTATGDESKVGWIIVKLNFSQILSRQCNSSDYQLWNPVTNDHGCLLGQNFSYERRIADHECFNGDDYEHATSVSNCTCTNDDFECDYGYELKDSVCAVASWYNADTPVYECEPTEQILNSTGYRKVASDTCVDSEVTSKYRPTSASCPLVKPRDVSIDVIGGNVVAVGANVTFQLTQEEGSHSSTVYLWDFGDGYTSANITGFKNAEKQSHIFKQIGFYTVVVTARNDRGSDNASVKVWAQDRLAGLRLTVSHAVQIKKPATFQLTPQLLHGSRHTLTIDELAHVHYLWLFGDEATSNKKGDLTWTPQAVHSYAEPGNYTIWVEAFTGAGSVFQTTTLPVYGTLTTLQMTLQGLYMPLGLVDSIFEDTVAMSLHKVLTFILGVDPTRLDVEYNQMTPIILVSVLPVEQTMTTDPSIDQIVDSLLKLAANGSIVFNLPDESFGAYRNIVVTRASILIDTVGFASGYSVVGLAVGIPGICLIVVAAIFIIVYYRRKLRRMRHYSVLHSRYREDASGTVGTSLLEDTDDDDPLIDSLNAPSSSSTSSSSHQRLALSDEDDDPLCARIIMPGANDRDDLTNC